jgi:putative cell wall-binding protein
VNGENFPDGLAASAFAPLPILLTKADALPAETLAALDAYETSCGSTNVPIIVVGGEAVVGSAVYEALDTWNEGSEVERIGGADRYATALAVATSAWTYGPVCNNMILATGTAFPDALAAGPLGKVSGAPIILNSGSSLRADVKAYAATCFGDITIVGGTAAVPQSVEDELKAMGKTVTRIAGSNRAETAAAIAGELVEDYGFVVGLGNVILVNCNTFADALSASPLAYIAAAPILCVNAGSIPPVTAGLHVGFCNFVSTVWAIGGTAVISDAVLAGAAAATACTAPALTSASLVNSGYKQAACELNGNVSGADGVVVSAVPGSAADGAAGNNWSIAVVDVADGDANFAIVNPVAQTMTIGIKVPAATAPAPFGLTQQQLVDAWIAIGGDATKYFVPSVTIKTGAPSGYIDGDDPDGGPDCEPANGSQTQTIVINFNIPVMDDANPAAGVVLQSNDFTGTAGFTVVSPLVATPGGAASYTLVAVNVTNAADLRVAGTDSVNVANGAVFSAATGIVADHTLADTKLS